LALLNQIMRRVGAGLAAYMANATVAGHHRRRQLTPCLRTVLPIQGIAPHTLCGLPAGRLMYWRLPWHEGVALENRNKKRRGMCMSRLLVMLL
jgi:hypothetical protein